MQTDLDLVIIGAGCAGLSLGVQLAKMNEGSPKTLLLEQRNAYENDRTWCFWGHQSNVYPELINHQWTQLIVQSEEEKIFVECAFAPYQILSAKTFYESALESIELNPLIELRMNTALLKEPQYHHDWWYVETSLGTIRSKSIVDTRPKPLGTLQNTQLWQSFLGVEIECDDSVFDPRTAVLMDFCKANAAFVGFNYVLPQSERKALIEFTVFAKRPYIQQELAGLLDQSVIQYTDGIKFSILRKEYGLIPMGLVTDQVLKNSVENIPTYVHAGLTAGAARPATGYAFQRIQNWAIQCAQSIAKSGLPVPHAKDSFLNRKMDHIFLNVIGNDPVLGLALFMDLFKKVDSRRLVRFLSDRGQLLDYLAVIRALPAFPFLKEIFNPKRVR
jgi:lycopene beta-cyclase